MFMCELLRARRLKRLFLNNKRWRESPCVPGSECRSLSEGKRETNQGSLIILMHKHDLQERNVQHITHTSIRKLVTARLVSPSYG